MWFYTAKTADLALGLRRGFFFCGLEQKNLGVEHFEGVEPATHQFAGRILSTANWTGNGRSVPWFVNRWSCRWWEPLAGGRGSVAPLLLLLLSPGGTCRMEIQNTSLPSAVDVVKGTQHKALPSCCYLVSHALLWVTLCWVWSVLSRFGKRN